MIGQFLYCIYLSLVASGFVFSYFNRKQLGSYATFLTILLGMVLLFESFDYYIDVEQANLLNHFYQPLEFTLMVLIYGKVFNYSRFNRLIIPAITGFWAISLYLSIFVEGIQEYNTLSMILGYFCVIVLAAVYHAKLFTNKLGDTRLFRQPFFWINTAHLFFYLGTFFQMGFNAYLRNKSPESAHNLLYINYVLNLSLYSLYLVGFTCKQIFKSR